MRPAYLVLAALYMGLIFLLSAQPGSAVGIPAPWDKLAHAGEYAVLGWLLGRGSGGLPWAWGLGALYGAFDEVHQGFVPGREADAADWLADAVGVALGAWAALKRGW